MQAIPIQSVRVDNSGRRKYGEFLGIASELCWIRWAELYVRGNSSYYFDLNCPCGRPSFDKKSVANDLT